MSEATPLLSIVVPTLNEAANVPGLAQAVSEILRGVSYELILVDDDSPDRTWEVAGRLAEKNPRIRVIRRRGARRLSCAVVDGFRQSKGEILAVMDADLSHDPAIVPEMIRRIEGGADLAVGSRRVEGGGAEKWPWHRRLMSDIATWLARSVVSVPLSDPMSGYFALRREVFEGVRDRLRPKGYKILLEIVCRARPRRIEEVPFVFKGRKQGYSKLTPKVMLHFLEMLFELRFGFSPLDPMRHLHRRARRQPEGTRSE